MISNEDVENLAELSRLELREGEVEKFKEDISEILSYVEQIGDVENEHDPSLENVNTMREDERTNEPGEYTEAMLEAAPDRKGQFLKIHKILSQDE